MLELCHIIGAVYTIKAASYIKRHRKSTFNLFRLQDWWEDLAQKGGLLTDALKLFLSFKSILGEFERRVDSGELESEILEEDTARIMAEFLCKVCCSSQLSVPSEIELQLIQSCIRAFIYFGRATNLNWG